MKKKEYERPTMKVVKVQHRGLLMTSGGNNVSATMSGTFEEEDI
jgi:hypothetical protein